MGIQILLDPGVAGPGPLPAVVPGPAPADGRTPGFRDLERKVLAEFARMADEYEQVRGKAGGGTLVPGRPGESEIALNRTLLAGLCLRYVTHGWPGIISAQATLMELADTGHVVTAADVRFFHRTRGLVRLLVSRTLIDLEERAARFVQEGEKACREEVERTWSVLGMKSPEERAKEEAAGSGAYSPSRSAREPWVGYTASNDALTRGLHARLSDIAAVLRGVDEVLRAQEYLRGSRAGNRATDDNFARIAADTAQQANPFFQDPVFTEECPLGLLGIRLVDRLTTREQLVDRLGMVLDRLRVSLAQLSAAKPGGRAERVVGPRAARAPDGYDLTGGPELALIDRAFKEMRKAQAPDKGWLPLVHQPTWERLVGESDLPEGGWGLAVAGQYLRALRGRRRDDAEKAKAEALFWQRVDKIASGLSLIAFFATPIGGVALAVASRVLTAASLTLLVHQVTSAVDQASFADEKLLAGVARSGPEARGADALAELGEVALFRHQVLGETVGTISVMLLAQLAGGKLRLVRDALEHYSYLQDIQTIMEPSHGGRKNHEDEAAAADASERTHER